MTSPDLALQDLPLQQVSQKVHLRQN